jgi:hypothetical protein
MQGTAALLPWRCCLTETQSKRTERTISALDVIEGVPVAPHGSVFVGHVMPAAAPICDLTLGCRSPDVRLLTFVVRSRAFLHSQVRHVDVSVLVLGLSVCVGVGPHDGCGACELRMWTHAT